MASDTRPVYPVTGVTAHPSPRHTRCDGSKWAATCANGSCDGCDGHRSTPSHSSQTGPAEPYGSLAARPVTPTKAVGLPLAPLSAPPLPPSRYYAVTPIDARGRLADRSPVRALGWRPGQPITITVFPRAVLVVTPQTGGADSLTRQGHLRLPARIRHACHLSAGDRLLVAAAPTPDVLVIYTAALLESILLNHHLDGPLSGEPAR